MISDRQLLWLRRITVCLKRIPGLILLLDPLRKKFSRTNRRIVVADFDGSLKMGLELGEHMQSQIFWYGYYCRDIILLMDRILRPGMVVIDVGANIGEVTMAAARRIGPTGQVYSFEPMESLYARLAEHLQLNHLHQVKPIARGLSDKTGSATIFKAEVAFNDGTRHDGLGTLYPTDSRAVVAGEIELTTLDKFCSDLKITNIDLVKIDVEGAELNVLKGSLESLKRFQPYLIVEIQPDTAQNAGYQPNDIISLLRSLGYTFFVIGRKARLRPLSKDDLATFHNVLCVPDGAEVI